MTSTQSRMGSLLATAALSTAAWAVPVHAVDFSGERIEILVPYAAGGGTDLYARFLAPHLSEALPGNPTVFVNNVPGAGAIAGSNQFEERAEPDGTMIVAIAASMTSNFVFRDERVQYRLDEWIPFVSSPNGTIVYGHSSLGIESPEDIEMLTGQQLVLGANNPSGGDMRALLSTYMLGLEVQPVFGINRGDARPSFERGEFTINFDTTPAYVTQVQPLVDAGVAVPLFSFGIASDDGEIVRDPVVPDLPTFIEAYRQVHGEDPSGPAYNAWLAIFNLNIMASKALALPAGTPQEIVDVYAEAMEQVLEKLAAPEYAEQADEIIGPYPQALGAAAERALSGAIDFDDETYAWLETWLEENF